MDDSTTPLKRCTLCGFEFPATPDYFQRDSQKKDGFYSQCKPCKNASNQKHRNADRDNYRRKMREWHASHRDKSHEHSAKYRNANREKVRRVGKAWKRANPEKVCAASRARYAARPEISREHNRKWRKKNPDHTREYSRLYNLANPNITRISNAIRRARKHKLPHTFNQKEWLRSLEYFNYRCAACGKPAGFWHILAQDHWIALTDKRPDNPGTVASNIVPLCNSINDGQGGCNNSKNNRDPETWLIQRFGKRKAAVILARIQAYFVWVKEQDKP